jgi:hypothetical protein
MQLVDLRTYPSNRLTTAIRNPSLPFAMLEKRIEPGKMQPSLEAQWRYPKGIIFINMPGDFNENSHLAAACNRTDCNAACWLNSPFGHDGGHRCKALIFGWVD